MMAASTQVPTPTHKALKASEPEAVSPRWRLISASRRLLVLPSIGWWVAFFVTPLLVLFVYSFGQLDIITFQMSWGWTLDNYARLGDGLYMGAIVRSLALAAGATVLTFLLGFPVAYYMSRQGGRMQQMLLVAILIPFWVSFVIRTYAWISVLDDQGPLAWVLRSVGLAEGGLGLAYSDTAVLIGMTATYLPLMILPLFVALDRIDDALLHAAADLGANSRRTMWRVIVPLARPGIAAGCLLVGVPALGEYVIPSILSGGKTLMLGNVIGEQFLSVGDYPFGAALATTFMVVITGFLVIGRARSARREDIL
jgi:ABC-type spermidine/putrescine transport system permease subunit I